MAHHSSNNTRISRLAKGLFRFQYSPSNSFSESCSIRIPHRPKELDFESLQEDEKTWSACADQVEIHLVKDGESFNASNLWVQDRSGHKIWDPSSVDHQNFGGAHTSLDYMKKGFIPKGVHPATCDHHQNDSSFNLWSFHNRLHSVDQGAIGDGSNMPKLFDEVLASTPEKDFPPLLRELLDERQKFPPGVLSASGYFLYNDSPSPLYNPEQEWLSDEQREEGALDLYLFVYGDDRQLAMEQHQTLFGASPLAPRYTFGLWYSRYPTFSEKEIYELKDQFDEHDLPLDVFVFDLEWHKRGWFGFDWDTDHIPHPDQLLGDLNAADIHTTFNVHPDRIPVEDSRFDAFLEKAGISVDKSSIEPDYKGSITFGDFDLSQRSHAEAFMDVLHKPIQDQGVDFWWIDGHSNNQRDDLDNAFWTNHIYHQHIKNNFQDRRPLIFSRTAGFGSHRYALHFTGDSWSTWEALHTQVEYTLRAGHMGQSLMTHDIGGHLSNMELIDPELYLRWVQFATLSPMVRLHSSKMYEGVGGERRPWVYGQNVLKAFKAAMSFRMELLPYLYSLNHQSHALGLPICRSNALQMGTWKQGESIWDSYFLGDRIYAAPQLEGGTIREVTLPPGTWVRAGQQQILTSDGESTMVQVSHFDDLPPHYVKAGSLLIKQPYSKRASELPETLILEIYGDDQNSRDDFTLYEDDGLTQNHQQGVYRTQRFESSFSADKITVTIHPCQGHVPEAPQARTLILKNITHQTSSCQVNGQTLQPQSNGEIIIEDQQLGESVEVVLHIY